MMRVHLAPFSALPYLVSGVGALFALSACSSEPGAGPPASGGASASGGDGSGGAPVVGAGGASGSVATGGIGVSGGATGSGGSAGSPPHFVGTCDDLGHTGQWEDVTPDGVTLEPPYTGVLLGLADPQRSGTVYAMTSRSGVFKSTDCGATWAKINTGRNADQLDAGLIWSAVIDPAASDTLYALTGYGPAGLWKTTNGGVDWDQILPLDVGMPGFVARVNMDPTDSQHLIINFHDNCTGGHAAVCFGETKDGGSTWTVLDFPPSLKNGWGEGTAVMPLDATHWVYTNWELYYTADAGQNWKQVMSNAAAGVSFFHAPNGKYYLGAGGGVLESSDGATWSQIPDSGYRVDAVVGDSSRLYAVQGFFPPDGDEFIWSAPYSDDTSWSPMPTPGVDLPLAAGSNGADYDPDHHVLYVALQGEGLWRVVTE